jgi:hypothetical protein
MQKIQTGALRMVKLPISNPERRVVNKKGKVSGMKFDCLGYADDVIDLLICFFS